ncbi:MAG: serine/threonine-protein kinase [Phormidesmis sp.]
MKLSASSIGHYDIQKQFSIKAGRQTFLAQDIRTQESVIVKVIQIGRDFQWNDLKLFEREARMLEGLDHPAIPKYKDYFETDIEGTQSFVLVQTYIEANALDSLVRAGRRFSEAEIVELAERLLAVLSYLHEQTPVIVHRDIKPSNILIADRSGNSVGDVYLVDFGSVHTVASKESGTITIVGSYGYIPLEQFVGQAAPASDLYSLGMTLIYLITGIHPADIPQVNGKAQLPCNSLQPRFARWLARMTHPYVDQRFDSAPLALAALKARESGEGYYHHLKPVNSKVELYRDHTHLEIVTEGQYRKIPDVVIGLLSTCFYLSLFSLGLMPITWVIFVLPAALLERKISDFIHTSNIVDRLTPHYTVISINRESGIRLETRFLSSKTVRWQKKLLRFQDIDLLAYNPGYTFNHKGRTIKVSPTLSAHAGAEEYPIGHSRLSQAEFWWLGQELSDFIGVEMQTIYPTPVVPPQSSCGGGC